MHRYDLTNAWWRKSSYSGGSGGEACVEVADRVPGVVPVRDSKVSDGPVIVVSGVAWTNLIHLITNRP